MKIAIGSDEYTELVGMILKDLGERGHEVEYFGPLPDSEGSTGEEKVIEMEWPITSSLASSKVLEGKADEAIVLCWTGTGASIAANKMNGIRAALCHDAETAKGARIWNHANVLALSIRATSLPVAREILNAWFDTAPGQDEWNLKQIERLRQIEKSGKP